MMPLGHRRQVACELEIAHVDALVNDRMRMIKNLRTEPAGRRKGDARWLMCEVCVEADMQNTVLVLEPKPTDDGPLDADALELWYRRFGFKTIQREPIVLMARQPR